MTMSDGGGRMSAVSDSHEHDWWRTLSGSLECACGMSRRPFEATEPKEQDQ